MKCLDLIKEAISYLRSKRSGFFGIFFFDKMINLRGFKYGTCDVVTLHLHYLEKLISTAYEIDFILSVCEEVYRDVRKL